MSLETWPLFSTASTVSEVETDGGMVVGPDQYIADAGAAALRAGGNAVDAAVAAALATGVVEPGSAGIGGSAMMTIALRNPDRFVAVEGHMVAPKGLRLEDYPLAPQDTKLQHIEQVFGMAPVQGHANLYGGKAVTIPGTIACLFTAHERYGALPLAKVLEPVIALAADGFFVNWCTSAYIVSVAARMSKNPPLAELFLPRGVPASGPILDRPDRIVQPAMARTLEILAAKGADAFYRGELGRSIVDQVRSEGGALSMEDLESYRADVFDPPRQAPYGPFTVVGAPYSGTPTLLSALYMYEAQNARGGAPAEAVAWARALALAFADRARYMTHDPAFNPPWEVLASRRYAEARLAAELDGRDPPDPSGFDPEAAVSTTGRAATGTDRHTSQMTTVDREGNIVSLTATMMNAFGSQVFDPDTGILLNGGLAYFDPVPGSINSMKPGVKVLSAMTPVVLVDDDRGPFAGVGASGGRRIISVVARIVGAIADGETSMQRAIDSPLIHAESKRVLLDTRWPREAAEALDAAGFDVVPTPEEPGTTNYARPYGIVIGPDGVRRSGADPKKPAGIAVG